MNQNVHRIFTSLRLADERCLAPLRQQILPDKIVDIVLRLAERFWKAGFKLKAMKTFIKGLGLIFHNQNKINNTS
ncbi:hypothetical protein ACN6UN_002970 [Cronobacter turicensis]|uniref:hypothetical protein n=1 Tax=Cronobacter turicensis TaxID=413502 RepID=UPI0024C33678|nr:hypothetical protein [Cronobacter turicensis]MDK1237533.1 hypothetical protein [Cronobacter turicensis]